MTSAGRVLSQPPTSTTASIGWAADHLLGRHGHEVAVEHAGRRQEHLAERDHREVDRQRAGRKHAAFDGLDELGHAAMAVVEARGRLGDADDRLCQELARIAHRACKRAPQIGGESRIAVVGEPAFEALAFALRHAAHPCTKARRGSNGFRRAPAFSRPWRPEALGDARLEKRGAREAWSVHSRPADVRTEGWEGQGSPPERAEPDLPRDALGPWPRDFGASRPRINRGFGALSASARTRVFHRDGRGRRQDAGRRALVAPETGRRRTLRHRLAKTGSAPHQPDPALPPFRATALRLRHRRLRAAASTEKRCRPAFERLRKRPSRAGHAS